MISEGAWPNEGQLDCTLNEMQKRYLALTIGLPSIFSILHPRKCKTMFKILIFQTDQGKTQYEMILC